MAFPAATVKELERSPPPSLLRPVYAVTETVAGFNGARMVTALSDSTTMYVISGGYGLDWSSNATSGVSFGGVYYAGAGEYDPAFVSEILAADAAPAEEGFDNVVDLLDWLNRD